MWTTVGSNRNDLDKGSRKNLSEPLKLFNATSCISFCFGPEPISFTNATTSRCSLAYYALHSYLTTLTHGSLRYDTFHGLDAQD